MTYKNIIKHAKLEKEVGIKELNTYKKFVDNVIISKAKLNKLNLDMFNDEVNMSPNKSVYTDLDSQMGKQIYSANSSSQAPSYEEKKQQLQNK